MRSFRSALVAFLVICAPSALAEQKLLDAEQLRGIVTGTTFRMEHGSRRGNYPIYLIYETDGTLRKRVETPRGDKVEEGSWNILPTGFLCVKISGLPGGREKACLGLVLKGEDRLTRVRPTDGAEIPSDMIVSKPGPGFAKVAAAVLHPPPPVATAMRSPTPAPAPSGNAAFELAFWDAIKNSRNPEDYRAYLRQFPNGRFAELAKVRGREHETQTARLPSPSTAPPQAKRPQPVAHAFNDIHFGKYYAVVVGNDDYKYLNPLKTAVNDARAVASELERDYGFDVTLLENATRGDVLRELAELRAKLVFDDNLLIYYAGHGVLDEVGQQGYWLPVDAESGIPTNWISTSDITVMLRAIRAKHIMVVADSCYSGTLVRAAIAEPVTARDKRVWISRMLQKRSRVAIVSGGLEPVADSGGTGDHSVFASAFLAALRDNASVMEGQALFNRLKRPVVLNADQTPQYSDIRKAGHDGGEFLFVRKTN